MKVEPEQFFSASYADRQFITFVDDEIIERAASEDGERDADEQASAWRMISRVALALALPNFVKEMVNFALPTVIAALLESYRKAHDAGVNVIPIPKSWVGHFKLPPGQPRNAVILAGHPAIAKAYFPVADFHRVAFEHKFSELMSILVNLGAVKLAAEHVAGWNQSFGATASVSIPVEGAAAEIGASASVTDTSSRKILFTAEFPGNESRELPQDLIWYHHEPTWQQMATSRLQFGVKKATLNLQYQEDFGINAELKGKLGSTGLSLGGELEDHKSTTWSVEVEFE